MGDSGHGSPAHPSLASSRRKVEMIKQVKDKNKVVVVEVGEIVTLVEQCEAKTGDKEPKFLIKKKDGHKYKVKDSYFKEWVDPSIPPPPPPPPPPTADEIIDDLLPDLCDVAVWEAELDVRLETENFRKTDTAVCAMFEQIDANNDGVVTMRELTMALKRDRGLGKRLGLKLTGGEIHDKDGSREEIKEFFARHDVDDEAGLQLHEFYTALRPEGPPPPLPDHIASALPTDEDLDSVFAAVDPTEIVEEVQMREILEVLESSPELQLAFGLKVPGGEGDRGTNDVASRETYAQFLARWDREGDRTLSRAEFKGIFGRRYELRNPALVAQLTKRAMERDIGDLFAKIDKNHDGRVSKPELILALRRDEALALRLGLCKGAIRDDSRASLENFFAEFDADGDKQLSMEEFSHVFLKSIDTANGADVKAVGTKVIVMPDVGVEPHVVDYLFAKIDKDGDGKLSIRELVTSLREDPSLAATLGLDFKNGTGEVDDDACAALEEWFNTYDSNGDKEFDKDEFYQIFVKRDDGPGPPSAGNTNDVSAEEAARRETHAAEIAAEIAQSIREATELERVKDTLSKREKEMEELKAQMVRLQTGGGETTESAPSAPSDLDSSEAGDGDTTEESTPTSTPEKQSGVSGDVDVGDISKAKKLLGMSPPVDVSGPAYDNYMAYIQSPKFNRGMTKDGRSPVCKMDSAKKGLNVTPLRPFEKKKRLVDELIDEAPPAVAGYEKNWMTSLRNGDPMYKHALGTEILVTVTAEGGETGPSGRRMMKIKRDGNLKSFLAAAAAALVLDKKPLSAFVRDPKDGVWKEIADTLRLQSEQHVMVSHGEPTVRPGDSKKASPVKISTRTGYIRAKDFNELMGDYKALNPGGQNRTFSRAFTKLYLHPASPVPNMGAKNPALHPPGVKVQDAELVGTVGIKMSRHREDLKHQAAMQPVSFHRNVVGDRASTMTSTAPDQETKFPRGSKGPKGRVWVPGY